MYIYMTCAQSLAGTPKCMYVYVYTICMYVSLPVYLCIYTKVHPCTYKWYTFNMYIDNWYTYRNICIHVFNKYIHAYIHLIYIYNICIHNLYIVCVCVCYIYNIYIYIYVHTYCVLIKRTHFCCQVNTWEKKIFFDIVRAREGKRGLPLTPPRDAFQNLFFF
jgi:hypothetical protein